MVMMMFERKTRGRESAGDTTGDGDGDETKREQFTVFSI